MRRLLQHVRRLCQRLRRFLLMMIPRRYRMMFPFLEALSVNGVCFWLLCFLLALWGLFCVS